MFSKPLNLIRRTIGFRLTVWFSSIMAGSFLILFTLAYMHLSLMIRDYDRSVVQEELNECVDQFQGKGVRGLEREVEFERRVAGRNEYFVRLTGAQGQLIFLNVPDEWIRIDTGQFESKYVDSDKEWFHLEMNDHEFEIASLRLADGYVMQVGRNIETRKRLLRQFHVNSAVVIIVVIALSFVGGIFLASRTLRPLRHLVGTLRSIYETGRIDVRAPRSQSGDEIDVLIGLFNALLEKIEALIAGMRGSLDIIAHDLRTPLTRLRGIAETALQLDPNQEVLREALMDSLEESKRITSMLNTLMDISEADAGTMKLNLDEVKLSSMIEEIVELYRYVGEEKDIRIRTSCDKELYLRVDPVRMRQVLANLLDNALKYTLAGGRVDIECCRKEGEIVIAVKDTGIGIAPAELPKIWDRLYRGNESRSQRGMGLGLSLVKAIVQTHNGRVDVSSEPGTGSIFSIYLPEKA